MERGEHRSIEVSLKACGDDCRESLSMTGSEIYLVWHKVCEEDELAKTSTVAHQNGAELHQGGLHGGVGVLRHCFTQALLLLLFHNVEVECSQRRSVHAFSSPRS